jgi:hypothetical protein
MKDHQVPNCRLVPGTDIIGTKTECRYGASPKLALAA